MGHIVPDRFFWALPAGEDGDAPDDGSAPDDLPTDDSKTKGAVRRVH
jgi:hydroxymethylpyrimidine/phosphomethylpyrimidine kinase